ncbi:D-alanyl-D-alanine dipeptidase [Hyella patelloides LEGE 07179]|uniref:D-alanyl-D-alanine dipeptidase n=1 Tax=Hyella patelloides LEGE 07179 TaxID=945734 RepID=A0A563VUE0_9CYAN|nr:M15 family metallopeptidase [Hyella patelloides]VEP15028.1 D-alanyl-D-alanine dipeptidase [Hyella patelloides LEGE 07179]
MKPYQKILIRECNEPLIPIPLEKFAVELPHPYEKLGAEYGQRSPYCLRQGVVEALEMAQFFLGTSHPGWKLKIYDAYRPVGVQQFMVDYTFDLLLKKHHLTPSTVSAQQRQNIWEQVYQLWAVPSIEKELPPPHSTGAAIDLTLVNSYNNVIDMGGEIDELSERSHPNYYQKSKQLVEQQYHRHRQLLNQVMTLAGFMRHPGEWWHFSLGDQMWAWLHNQQHPENILQARYGRI